MSNKVLAEKIAEEIIDELMMAGLAFMLILLGVNYFNMEWAWTKIITDSGAASGITSTAAATEFSQMMSALTEIFPFKYLFGEFSFWGSVIAAVCLTGLGFALKAFTVKTKGKLIIDVGKNIYKPAILGFISIIALQVWTAFHIDEYIKTKRLILPTFGSGYFIWQTYGQLFLIGASLLVIGSIVKLIGEKNHYPKTRTIGDAVFNGSFILLVYYIIIRILATDIVIHSEIGRILNIMIVSNQYSSFTVIICVFMFTFGIALRNFGITMLKHEKRLFHMEALQRQQGFMMHNMHARPAEPQTSTIKLTEHHLRPAHPQYPSALHQHKEHPYTYRKDNR